MPRRANNLSIRRSNASSNGLAVVELAVCLPLLMVVFFATVEICWMLQLKQNVTMIAYEGARIAAVPGTNVSSVTTQCSMLLDDRDITNYQITLVPSDLSTIQPGDNVSVSVSAPFDNNSLIGWAILQGQTVRETIVIKAN